MSEHNATPGPWDVREYRKAGQNGGIIVDELMVILPRDQDGDDLAIAADILNPLTAAIDEVAYANAHLIAAAPDLRDALKEARGIIVAILTRTLGCGPDYVAAVKWKIDAALLKAQGKMGS